MLINVDVTLIRLLYNSNNFQESELSRYLDEIRYAFPVDISVVQKDEIVLKYT